MVARHVLSTNSYLVFPDLGGFLNLVTDPSTGVDISQKQRVDQRRLPQAGLSHDEDHEIEASPERFSIDLVGERGEANSECPVVTEIVSVLTVLSLLTVLIVRQFFFINVIHQLMFLLDTSLSRTKLVVIRRLLSPIFQSKK